MNGTTRLISSDSLTSSAPGRVDCPPMSTTIGILLRFVAGMCSVNHASRPAVFPQIPCSQEGPPPSENESGVTLKTAMILVDRLDNKGVKGGFVGHIEVSVDMGVDEWGRESS